MKQILIPAIFLVPVGVFAQSTPPDDTAALVRELARRVGQLEKRVEDLEGQLREARTIVPAAVARTAPPAIPAAHGMMERGPFGPHLKNQEGCAG